MSNWLLFVASFSFSLFCISFFRIHLYLHFNLGLAPVGLVHHPHMVIDCAGKCEFPCWKISCSRIPTKTHIPLLESPQIYSAHRYRSGLHLWVSLFRGGWHCSASIHALARSSWHWRILAGETWALARNRTRLCSSRLRVLSQAGACTETLIVAEINGWLFCFLYSPSKNVFALLLYENVLNGRH